MLRQALRQGERAALLLALAVTAVYVLDRWVAWGYVLAVREGRKKIGDRPLGTGALLPARRPLTSYSGSHALGPPGLRAPVGRDPRRHR
ncbi:hypothetical protein GCM10023080_025210 [Streptomyces pseudoechinosporeus]